MFSLLPDLSPRDSHALWYSSSRHPIPDAQLAQPSSPNTTLAHDAPNGAAAPHRRNHQLLERSALAHLRADEHLADLRRHNVMNFGSAWLKPPGVVKTLHQMREERREQEEHAEAVRREALAQELAEAGAGAGGEGVEEEGAGTGTQGGVLGEDGDEAMADEDVQLDGAGRDLDDEIPDAEEAGFGTSEDEEDEDEDEEESSDEEDDDEDDDEDDEDEDEDEDQEATKNEMERALMAQRMTAAAREREGAQIDADDASDADAASMLEEEDLVSVEGGAGGGAHTGDMNRNLDDDIPEADEQSAMGYEYTDSEADMDSSVMPTTANQSMISGGVGDTSFATASAAPASVAQLRRSGRFSDGGRSRHSLAISDLLSGESSFLGSSPNVPRHRSAAQPR